MKKQDKEFDVKVCVICGGNVVNKEIEEVVKGGKHTALVNLHAKVCNQCGERYFTVEQVKLFEKIENDLLKEEIENYSKLGWTFRVPAK